MHPDSEMTLLDVLSTCPEFLSINGKKIDLKYNLRVDNIDFSLDPQSFLANVKACEIDQIQICSNTSVAKAVNGTKGVIDIYYRKDVKTDGKVALTGALLIAEFHPVEILDQLFPKGVMTVLADKWNVGILTFLVILGTMVQLMNRAGGSAAFGAWASKRIKSCAGAQLSYALTAASVSFFTFLVAGFTKSALLSLLFGIAALFLLLLFIRHRQRAVQS